MMFGSQPPPPPPPQAPAPQRPWQMKYAYPDWQKRLTTLNPNQETMFQLWAKINKVPITDDYDMRGFWQNRGTKGTGSTAIDPNDGLLHYPDTYKTPLHQSFSGESIYANPATSPPKWNDQDQLIDNSGQVLFDDRAPR